MNSMDFANSTHLDGERLARLLRDGMQGWPVGAVTVRVRYSRGADFSGTCFYADRRIFINLGSHLRYPYDMASNLGKVQAVGRRWFRPTYLLRLHNPYELVVFIFMHELYHLLVKLSRRNTRQKESMCDRFAARFVVDRFGARVIDDGGADVPRELWEFQDLDGFVAAAREPAPGKAARRPRRSSRLR